MASIDKISPKIIIKSYYTNLSKTEKIIADYILNNYKDIKNINITDLSKNINVAESSIVRFTKRLGYKGFKEFKIYCAVFPEQVDSGNYFDNIPNKTDSIESIIKTTFDFNVNNLKVVQDFLDYDILQKIGEAMMRKKKVYIVGQAFSGNIASSFYYRLRIILPQIVLIDDTLANFQYQQILDKNSMVLVVSQTGQSSLSQTFTKEAVKHRATTACITRVINNPISSIVDYPIVINSIAHKGNTQYLTTEMVFLVILDCLYMFILLNIQNNKSIEFKDFDSLVARMDDVSNKAGLL